MATHSTSEYQRNWRINNQDKIKIYFKKKMENPQYRKDAIERAKLWGKLNPDKKKQHKRNNHIKRTYGISPYSFEALLQLQGGVCAICSQIDQRNLSIDHCHKTGIVRGLLCDRCNRGLGFFSDNPVKLRKAAEYLEMRS